MLDYAMDERGEFGLAEYLYRRIRDDIVSGAIVAEDRLPSKRALAQHLGVSVVTVESAYAQLVAEGYVEARPRRGYYAARLPQLPVAATATAVPAPAESPSEVHAAPSLLADLTHGAAAADPSAARLWERALRQAMAQESEAELFSSAPAQGLSRLRKAIARHLAGSRGMTVDPARIVVGAGAQMLYNLVEQLLGDERVYAVEDPGYARASLTYEVNGARVAYVPLDDEGLSVDALRDSLASVVHVMPSHQFPTGRVMSVARRYELLGWAAQEPGRYIVEDDYDCELRLAGRPIPPLASIDTLGNVLYVNTFSKSLGSALRMAYLVLPPALVGPYRERLGFYASTVSAPDQVVLARLLESGDYERHVSRYRKRSREVRDAFVEALLDGSRSQDLRVEEADSGLHFVVSLAAEEAPEYEQTVTARALERGVRVRPLSSYAHDAGHGVLPDGRARLVVQYDALTSEAAREVARILAAVL